MPEPVPRPRVVRRVMGKSGLFWIRLRTKESPPGVLEVTGQVAEEWPASSPLADPAHDDGTTCWRAALLSATNRKTSQGRLRVMYGRRPRCKRNLTISEAFGCSHVSGLCRRPF